MNKFKVFLMAAILTITAGSAMAQKSGYISMDQVVSLMPELRRVDTLLQHYQSDSLNPQFSYMVSEYNRKDSTANGKDSLKTPAAVRMQIRQELEQLAYQIQNWQQIAQNAMEGKRNTLLEPIYAKAISAVQQVAKDNGYGYVYTKEALLVAPPTDDLLPLVAKKLNLRVPAAGSARTVAPAERPTAEKPKAKTKE